ncbi:MAG: TolC family protein, partial [Polyangiaceae bacterium]|nr:TolC family protein [Polyangiaceae bacterium]
MTALVLVAALAAPQAVRAEPAPAPAPPPRVSEAASRAPVHSLRRCLELAEQNYPKIAEAKARKRQKEAQLSQAHTAPYSDWTLTGGIGPAPTVRGTSVYSPNTDAALTSNMALAWQMGIDGVVPLWTFGKISNLWDAAEAQVKVGEHEVKTEKNDVKLSVRRAFYGAQLARDWLALVREAAKQIVKHMGRLEARVASGDGDDIELLKLKM